jgi:hypothetical protein
VNAVWSNEQKRCLTALGYTLYRPAATAGLVATEAASLSLGANTRAEAGVVAQLVGASVGTTDGTTALLRALMRAANLDPAMIGDAQAWLATHGILPLALLRNDPVAKRALWPRLRTLRREHVNR